MGGQLPVNRMNSSTSVPGASDSSNTLDKLERKDVHIFKTPGRTKSPMDNLSEGIGQQDSRGGSSNGHLASRSTRLKQISDQFKKIEHRYQDVLRV